MPRALCLLGALALTACGASRPSAPLDALPAGLPALASPSPGHPEGAPLVLPFSGEAGQAVWLRARAVSGPTPVLCLASAEAWARTDGSDGGPEPDPADLAGDAVVCDYAADDYARESALLEVLPRSGEYVVVAADAYGGTPGAFRLDAVPGTRAVAPLPDGAVLADTLGAARPWALHLGGPVGVHFVRGQAGARLDVTVQSDAFAPYVEVGAWYGAAYGPLVGEGAAAGDSATASLVLPADGLYTVRVSGDGRAGAYTVRATTRPPVAWDARFPGGGDPSDRYALLVAVSDYPGVGVDQAGDLIGPRADGEAMRALLVETYGFRPENVVVLRDAEATREAVVEAFRRHLGQAGPGGTALFHYAGHGTQLPASALPPYALAASGPTLAEADHLDEALVLWGHGAEFAYLLDHEVGALAEGLSAGHTVVVLDNCHSGDGTRGEGGDAALRLLPFSEIAGRLDAPDALVTDERTVGAARHVLLAAARDEQPSLELEGLAPDGGRAGVFTTVLVEALREAAPGESFADVLARVRPRVERMTSTEMSRHGYLPQQPQVEGAQADAVVGDVLGPRP